MSAFKMGYIHNPMVLEGDPERVDAHLPMIHITFSNLKLCPENGGETVVVATEADDGAALAMQTLKLLSGGEPSGFNDLRYWKDGLYWFVNSGALAPYFAQGSNGRLDGAWPERQTPMYFAKGAGRGVPDVPTEEQWKEGSANCSSDRPQHYLRLCGKIEWYVNANHPMTTFGDHLGALKAVGEELGIPFECYDHCTPETVGEK